MRRQRDAETLKRSKQLRRDLTPPERALWQILRGHRLEGWKFTRQVPAEPYILDFACRRYKLAIELDGDTHGARENYDARRTSFLESEGWRVIRFSNADAVSNPEGVATMIIEALRCSPSPQPSPRWGEGA